MGRVRSEVGELGRQADQEDVCHGKETGFQPHRWGFLNELAALNSD